MRADARLVAEYRDGRTVLRELRSMAPLTLFPKRTNGAAVVHLVSSATSPLGGDELTLTVRVGAGARLRLSGVAATLALPGHREGGSRSTVHVEVERGGMLEYLPEPTVVTSRARHAAELFATLDDDARFHTREVLVLGRVGERTGVLRSTQRVVRAGVPLLHQTLDVGVLDRSIAHLAGRRVLATELLVGGEDPPEPAGGDWWSVTPLAHGGALVTALAPDVVTAQAGLDRARRCFPKMSC
ncbi:urease accessory protein UreD [Amycolatopsis acidiphila]|uniref:Urease accessory protein UreD n=1 Tax=Amycolatopsis acidiphila TaxID=715473 RepID=A0A558AJR4_9PSEU|nr:urease accessory protein UreD [Amycolatopsis acidiphila]TVT24514.1 urease accessory protein UreD [Amycolatopsis acidiphila]UIJ59275.1 urease accessory protein UreD [Amycolatopsis acidiphila]GHG79459.1 urease accessory protein UreD [Amycolatopsis acidiphila]